MLKSKEKDVVIDCEWPGIISFFKALKLRFVLFLSSLAYNGSPAN